MALAVNDAGDVLTDEGGAWKPAPRAVNDNTGENLVLDGGAWKPAPGAKTAPPTDTAPEVNYSQQPADPATLAADTTPPPQSLSGAAVAALGQGVAAGAGAVVGGVGDIARVGDVPGATQLLSEFDLVDQGKNPAYAKLNEVQRGQVAAYRRADPDGQAALRAEQQRSIDAAGTPNLLQRTGAAMETAAPALFPVDPTQEGHLTGAARIVGGSGPMVAAGALGGPAGVLAGLAAVGAQAYHGAKNDALAAGATDEDANSAAAKSAMGQMAAMSVPVGRVLQLVPVPLREGFLQTLVNFGRSGVELAAGNTLATVAQNYVASQTYDPTRPLLKATGDAGIDGFIAGLVVHGATSAIGAGRATAARPSVADIGAAPDIDTAIAAAGAVAQAPVEAGGAGAPTTASWGDLFGPSGQADLFAPAGPPEAPQAAQVAPGAAAIPFGHPEAIERLLGPQAAGADITNPTLMEGLSASQRAAAQAAWDANQAARTAGGDGLPGGLPEPTPAQKATALQKMVNQSAEDRLTPQGRDDNVYVEGVTRPESMKDFSPAAEGELSAALAHKTAYYTDSHYAGQHDAIVKENNTVMKGVTDSIIGDANSREAAMDHARELMPGSVKLFDSQQPVSAQPVVDEIKDILASPAGKRGGVTSTLNAILPKLYEGNDVNGQLESLPSMLKGVRDDITDKLYDKSPTVEGNAARTSRNQLQAVLAVVDRVIGEGLPGTRYQDYLSNLSAALGQVAKQDFLQRYLTGSKKLTDLSGNLLLNKVQGLLNDIQQHHADKTGGAKELTMSEINQIEAVRNELAAKDLLDRRAKVPGSPTPQIQNAAGILGAGPLGVAVRGGAEAALHGALAVTTHGAGNAALGAYRYFIKPQMDAAKAQQVATELAAMKSRLLSTAPNPQAAP